MDTKEGIVAREPAVGGDALRMAQNTYASSRSSQITETSDDERPDATMLNDPFEQKQQISRAFGTNPDSPHDMVLGEFSFAPTTETTVYTTKVVKTINFPPLMMKGPRHLHDLDPKQYPLAASPTPPAMKKFCFDVGGKPTVFREAEDPDTTLQQIREQNRILTAHNGEVRSKKQYGLTQGTPPKIEADSKDHVDGSGKGKSRKGTVSPSHSVSGVRTRSHQAPSTRVTRVTRRNATTSQAEIPRLTKSSSRLQYVQTSTPITPHVATRNPGGSAQETTVQHMIRALSPAAKTITPDTQGRDYSQTFSPQLDARTERSYMTDVDSMSAASLDDAVETGPATTPPTEPVTQATFQLPEPQYRPRPVALDTTAAQDASLPSPSLSPVTAAANMQNRRGYFDDIASISRRSTDQHVSKLGGLGLWKEESSSGQALQLVTPDNSQQYSSTSLMEIPRMLDTFEAMPTDMKRYFMFQMLRRCPKPVLHSIADTVNPALKCDFLGLLPPEIGQMIVGHLDMRSLCRASRTSRKWRQVIDSNETIWKNLLLSEGYAASAEEMRRAVLEGWGWQPWSSLEEAEPDLGGFDGGEENRLTQMAAVDHVAALAPAPDPSQPSSSRRSKRKIPAKTKAISRKVSKRKDTSADEVAAYDIAALTRHIESAEGPRAAATAAHIAVPSSTVGIESLRNLTLYKNIFRRHHLISEMWMQDDVKPKHLAFKAHARHVVTCLQFDSDKILTGSDDTNINVYDTKTGALRAKLQGHEGGVWALQYTGNTLVSGSTDRSVRVWDIEKGVCTHVFQGHTSTVRCLVILMPTEVGKNAQGRPIMMPKEPIIITGSRDSTLRVWRLPKQGEVSAAVPAADDAESPYFVRALMGHIHSVRAIAAHGDTLVSGSYDSTVRVWKISTGETVHRLSGHGAKVYSVVLDHERNRCISGSMDNFVKIWSLDTGTCLFTLEGHTSLVGLLDLQRDRLVSAAADSTLRIWDLEKGQCRHTLSAHTGAITCFQHDGKKVVSGSDRNLKMWDIKTGMFVRDLLTDLSGVWQVNFDERRCVAAVQRNNVTYIEILDFGASRDGVPASKRGRRIVVDVRGQELNESLDAVDLADD